MDKHEHTYFINEDNREECKLCSLLKSTLTEEPRGYEEGLDAGMDLIRKTFEANRIDWENKARKEEKERIKKHLMNWYQHGTKDIEQVIKDL